MQQSLDKFPQIVRKFLQAWPFRWRQRRSKLQAGRTRKDLSHVEGAHDNCPVPSCRGQEVVLKRPTFLSSPLYLSSYLLFLLSPYISPYRIRSLQGFSPVPYFVNPLGISSPALLTGARNAAKSLSNGSRRFSLRNLVTGALEYGGQNGDFYDSKFTARWWGNFWKYDSGYTCSRWSEIALELQIVDRNLSDWWSNVSAKFWRWRLGFGVFLKVAC